MPDGTARFGLPQPHPQTAGMYGLSGTIADYLEGQGYGLYESAARAYGELYEEVAAALFETDVEATDDVPSHDFPHLLDVDAWVSGNCANEGIEFPADPDEKCRLHIVAVRSWLKTLAEDCA